MAVVAQTREKNCATSFQMTTAVTGRAQGFSATEDSKHDQVECAPLALALETSNHRMLKQWRIPKIRLHMIYVTVCLSGCVIGGGGGNSNAISAQRVGRKWANRQPSTNSRDATQKYRHM